MFGKIYRTTIKTTLRNPATLLSLIAVGLLWYNTTNGRVDMGISGDLGHRYVTMLKLVYNWVHSPLVNMLPVFAAVVCSVGILQDKKNRFYDIEKVTGMKTLAYYLGKLAAFATICYAVLILFIAGQIIASRLFGQYRDAAHTMGVMDMLTRVLRNGVVLSIPSMFVYVSIPVSVSLLTNSAVAGIASGVVYSLIGMVFGSLLTGNSNFFGNYLYPISNKISSYMYYYDSEYFTGNFLTSFEAVVLSYILTLVVSLALLTTGYIALRQKND